MFYGLNKIYTWEFGFLRHVAQLICCVLLFPMVGFCQTTPQSNNIARFSIKGLSVTFKNSSIDPSKYILNITQSQETVQTFYPEVFGLKNPGRIVIDIPGFSSKRAASFKAESAHTKSIRTGVHKDKVRLVIDLNTDNIPAYRKTLKNGNFSLFMDFSATQDEYAQKSISPTDLSQSHPLPKITPHKVTKNNPAPQVITGIKTASNHNTIIKTRKSQAKLIVPNPVPTFTPEISSITTKKRPTNNKLASKTYKTSKFPKPATLSDRVSDKQFIKSHAKPSKLQAVSFRSILGTGKSVVELQTEGEPGYKLLKQNAEVYNLTLENTNLQNMRLASPTFPPKSIKGVSVVVARQKKGSVVVKLFVDENANVNAYRAHGKLQIEVSP